MIQYDQNPNYLQTLRIETVYGAYILLNTKYDVSLSPFEIDSLNKLPNDFEDIFKIKRPVKFNNKMYSYGVCLFNKWCRFKDIKIEKFTNTNMISEYLYENSISNEDYQVRISDLSRLLFWFVTLYSDIPLTFPLNELISMDINEYKEMLHKLPENPHIGQNIYDALISRIYSKIPNNCNLDILTKCGLGKVNKQLARMIGAIGYIADSKNIVDSKALKDTIIDGLNQDVFFQTATGARKGIVDKQESTPASGYLERSMVVNLSPIELDMDDCGTNIGMSINIKTKEHAISLLHRYYLNDNGKWEVLKKKDIDSIVGTTRMFRSPICCAAPGFKLCKKCFGDYNIKTPYIGILAGQYISERLTQLSMKTFHSSGSSSIKSNKEIVKFMKDSLIDIEPLTISEENDKFDIIFSKDIPENCIECFQNIPGYIGIPHKQSVRFSNLSDVENEDVTKTIQKVNDLLKQQSKIQTLQSIVDTYDLFINELLAVGQIYSIFVEIVLCNMYVMKDRTLFRHAIQNDISSLPYRKLGIKNLHSNVSKLLGLLYEPNNKTISHFSGKSNNILPDSSDTVLEKMWYGMS